MNKIRHITLTALVTLLAFISMAYIACTTETPQPRRDCSKLVCYNGGSCTNGQCICPSGYQGSQCEFRYIPPCDTIVCQNGGTCLEAKCQCPAGYDGNRCQFEARAKFYGKYTGTLTCPNDTTARELIVLPGNDLQQVLLEIDTNIHLATFIGDQTFNSAGMLHNTPTAGTGFFDGNNVTIFFKHNGLVQCNYKGKR